ncbi:MAG: hypothetical protein O9343_15470 [Burkholderiaceae bacterium]|jgi:hypothetical protein|nr:hypothetical protein [Burkholderiaceae bacterium]MCZ8176588.1 hypothetical protein [Burkholderiaceae bacterium]
MTDAGLPADAGVELLGWVAAALTVACFASGDMLRLRVLALGANVAFACYGWHAGLMPVLALHLALAPVNAWRLAQQLRQRIAPPGAAAPAREAAREDSPDRAAPALPAGEAAQAVNERAWASPDGSSRPPHRPAAGSRPAVRPGSG